MRYIFLVCATILLCLGCTKENGSKVEIYMLKSFNFRLDTTTYPATTSIINAVLADTPLVKDGDIQYYSRSLTTFKLRKDIKPVFQNYGPDKAFAITVDKQPVYFGKVHPAYLSSITFGIATIDPVFYNDNELEIHFATMLGNANLNQLDKRNDYRIINALRSTGRLK